MTPGNVSDASSPDQPRGSRSAARSGPPDLLGEQVQRIRLNRFLAQAGVASRRAADRLIAAGRVQVNGVTVEELGILVLPGRDQVLVDGEQVGGIEVPRYLVIHKPRGVVTTVRDPQGRPTILDLLGDRTGDARLFPVGRLDLDSEGLLLLTNDGTLAHRLLHPRYHVAKRYRVWTDPPPRAIDLDQLAAGVEIEPGVATRPALIERIDQGFEIEIREGKKRQIRRMCEALGLRVTRLLRTRFGPLELGALAPGELRPLTAEEIVALDQAAGLPHRRRPGSGPSDGATGEAD
jgi:pseudouridine synthase